MQEEINLHLRMLLTGHGSRAPMLTDAAIFNHDQMTTSSLQDAWSRCNFSNRDNGECGITAGSPPWGLTGTTTPFIIK